MPHERLLPERSAEHLRDAFLYHPLRTAADVLRTLMRGVRPASGICRMPVTAVLTAVLLLVFPDAGPVLSAESASPQIQRMKARTDSGNLIGSCPAPQPAPGESGGPDLTLLGIGADTAPAAARIRLKRRGYILPRSFRDGIWLVQEYTPVSRAELFHTVHVVSCAASGITAGVYFSSADSAALRQIASERFLLRGSDSADIPEQTRPARLLENAVCRRENAGITASYYRVKDFPTWVLALERAGEIQACTENAVKKAVREAAAADGIREAAREAGREASGH